MTEGQPSPEKHPLIRTSQLPIYRNLIRQFNQHVGEAGLHEASVDFLTKKGVKVNVSYENSNEGVDTEEILKEKPTIIVAAHNRMTTETLPLAASVPRNDIYIVGNACFLDWGKSFKDFVLPLYESHKSTSGLSARILEHTEFESGVPDPIENYRKNEPMMKDIIKKIDDGHQVIVIPTGNRVHQKPKVGIWHNGIGHIIRNIQNTTDTYIVMAKAGELYPRPDIANKKLFLFKINIKYFAPIKVSDFLSQFNQENLNSAKITRALEKKYYGF